MVRNTSKQAPAYSEKHLSSSEIENGVRRLRSRIDELQVLVSEKPQYDSAQVQKVQSKLTETVIAVFGDQSRRVAEVPNLKYPTEYWNWSEKHELQEDFVRNLPKAIAWVESHIESLEELAGDKTPERNSDDQMWKLIHPLIVKLCRKKYEDKHFADAVETAMKAVNERVKKHFKKQSGKELDGTPLMQQAFTVNNPIIVLADQSTQSGKDEQQGYMNIFAGAMQGIRNPKAHANLDIDSNRALHLLVTASLLMYKLDDAKVL